MGFESIQPFAIKSYPFKQAPIGNGVAADGTIELMETRLVTPTFVVPLENAFVNEGSR